MSFLRVIPDKSDHMKTIYSILTRGKLFLSAICLLGACSQDISYQEAMNKNQRKIEDPAKLDDANFLVEAKSNNLLQMKLTDLGSKNGYASTIVALAKDQHARLEELSDDIDNLARKEKIAVPDMMDETDNGSFYEVSKSDREDFDKSFVMEMKRVNNDNIQRYAAMATDAKDADVRAFAARQLDVFRTQQQKLEETERALLNTY
jgi:putative membrane protein